MTAAAADLSTGRWPQRLSDSAWQCSGHSSFRELHGNSTNFTVAWARISLQPFEMARWYETGHVQKDPAELNHTC